MEQEQSKIEKREDSFTITGSNGTIIVREEPYILKEEDGMKRWTYFAIGILSVFAFFLFGNKLILSPLVIGKHFVPAVIVLCSYLLIGFGIAGIIALCVKPLKSIALTLPAAITSELLVLCRMAERSIVAASVIGGVSILLVGYMLLRHRYGNWRALLGKTLELVQLALLPAIIIFSFQLAVQPAYETNKPVEQVQPDSEGRLIAPNKDTILLLHDKNWERLTAQERLDVLQTCANIECTYLGIDPVPVMAEYMVFTELFGTFSEEKYTITINAKLLNGMDSTTVLNTLLHEVYHAYQHSVVVNPSVDWDSEFVKNNMYFATANSWRKEFEDYQSGLDNFEGYYGQTLETYARNHAQSALYDYFNAAEEYYFARTDDTSSEPKV